MRSLIQRRLRLILQIGSSAGGVNLLSLGHRIQLRSFASSGPHVVFV